MSDILSGLNPQQREIARDTEGNILCLAGAGAGKTRVLTHRIAHLILDSGIRPWKILSVTFTNKAAREMQERLVELVGEDGRDVWMGTFHGTCVRILRRFGHHVGLDGGRFTIIDEKDQKKLLKEVIAACGFEYEPEIAAKIIGDAKNELLTASDLEERSTRQHEKDMANVYLAYEDKKRDLMYVDYDDLIMKTVQLLDTSKEARDHYQNQFQYVLTDETQDTNVAQFKLLQLLSAHHGNLFSVGDIDQSVYRWRGARIGNMLNFGHFFPNPKTYVLEQNYRSTQTIVNAANSLIENNKERIDKTSFSENVAGDAIVLHRADDDTREADFVCDVIQRTKQVETRPYSDFAVLYRTNRQSREIEKSLTQRGIPYKVLNGSAFYDRKEIKDTIGYLRAIDNTLDAIAFERIVNVPKRGIGKTTIDRIQDYSLDCAIPFTKALENVNDIQKITPKTRQKILDFLALLDDLRSFQGHEDFSMVNLIQKVLNDTGYKESLIESGKTEDESRIENLDELLNVASGWDKDNTTGKSLNDFLTETTLVSDVDGLDATEMVTLLTIHSSKGLEFPIVHIVGLEEGIFPHGRSTNDIAELEEERRLMYVALTRGEHRVYLSHCEKRYEYGNPQPVFNRPSRFLAELPRELIRRI
jgi:DNA helicase-2/ATP-dependent DNA helicase PcrA